MRYRFSRRPPRNQLRSETMRGSCPSIRIGTGGLRTITANGFMCANMSRTILDRSLFCEIGSREQNLTRIRLNKRGREGFRNRGLVFVHSSQQPLNEMNSPRGDGRVGLKGSNENDFAVLNPAAFAAVMSTKGISASSACSILVQHRVLS